MRILHIATSRYGGAGRAAWQQHQALLAAGVDSHFLSMDAAAGNAAMAWHTLAPPPTSTWQFWKPKKQQPAIAPSAPTVQAMAFQQQLDASTIPLQCEACSLPFSSWPLHQHPLLQSAAIINLHWVAGMIDYPTFFAGVTKPIVWTLHDMQPFLGLFHYENDERNNPMMHELNDRVAALKSTSIQQRSTTLVLTSPSHWLINKALQCETFAGLPAQVIPYSVNLEVFRPLQKAECRKLLGLPIDKRLVLFVSHQVDTPRKGFGLLHACMQQLASSYPQWGVVTVGNTGKVQESNYWAWHAGSQTDDAQLALFYGAVDVVAIPSLEDNLPNVLLEAFACGRPVLSLANGGMREHILEGINGWVSNSNQWANCLHHISNMPQLPAPGAIRHYAETHFAAAKQAEAYLQLYHQICVQPCSTA